MATSSPVNPPGSYRPWSQGLTVYDGDSVQGEEAFLQEASYIGARGVRFERFERNSGLFRFAKARLRGKHIMHVCPEPPRSHTPLHYNFHTHNHRSVPERQPRHCRAGPFGVLYRRHGEAPGRHLVACPPRAPRRVRVSDQVSREQGGEGCGTAPAEPRCTFMGMYW